MSLNEIINNSSVDAELIEKIHNLEPSTLYASYRHKEEFLKFKSIVTAGFWTISLGTALIFDSNLLIPIGLCTIYTLFCSSYPDYQESKQAKKIADSIANGTEFFTRAYYVFNDEATKKNMKKYFNDIKDRQKSL